MTDIDAAGGWGDQRSATGEATSSPKEMAAAAAQTVKQEAASFAESAKEKASEQISQHKETATRTLGDFANAIRKAGDELSQSDQSMASRLVRQAADGLENLSRSVSDKRPEELLDAVRDFGRRNPTAFVAGSVLVGLALGRFLKSSSTSSHTSMTTPATFSSAGSGLPDVGPAGAPTYDIGSDVTAAGATSMGAPENEIGGSELGSGDAGVEALTGDLSNRGSALSGAYGEDPMDEDAGAGDGDDRDRARFTPGS